MAFNVMRERCTASTYGPSYVDFVAQSDQNSSVSRMPSPTSCACGMGRWLGYHASVMSTCSPSRTVK